MPNQSVTRLGSAKLLLRRVAAARLLRHFGMPIQTVTLQECRVSARPSDDLSKLLIWSLLPECSKRPVHRYAGRVAEG